MPVVRFIVGLLLCFNACAKNADPGNLGACSVNTKSVTQSFAIDNKAGEAFGYHLNGGKGAVISAYSLKGGALRHLYGTESDERLGHQGLAIQYIDGNRYFWSSLNKNERPDSGSYAIRYRLDSNRIKGTELFRLFQDGRTGQSISPAVSYGDRYLIVKMSRKDGYEIRIFETSKLIQSGDFSKNYKYSFLVKKQFSSDSFLALQALASDGEYVYVLFGSMVVGAENKIDVYRLDGGLTQSIDVSQGEGDARNFDSGRHYEPESLAWREEGGRADLLLAIAMGDKGMRKCMLYKTGIHTSLH